MSGTRRTTTLEERLLIGSLGTAGLPASEIAARVGCSVATVRKWRARGRQGPAALVSQMGRPRQGPLVPRTLRARELREAVRRWRQQHPGWGPKTLRAELARAPAFAAGPLPSRATLARFLRAEGLSRRYRHRVPLPVVPRQRPQAPHELWEMDARGAAPVPDLGVVTLVQLHDRCSHVRLLSYPFILGEQRATRHLDTADYPLVLRLAFGAWGLPDRLQVDHESIFCDTTSASPFPTGFHLWLVALGVELAFSRVHCPTDQGLTERSHQLWDAQVRAGQQFASHAALVAALRERREFLNAHLPCRSIEAVPPLVAYPQAARPRRCYRPEWEGELLELSRVRTYLSAGRWYRRVSRNRACRLGDQVYALGRPWEPGSQVAITLDPTEGEAGTLVFRTEEGQACRRHPLRGVSKAELMGDLARIVMVPGYQPCLPFSYEDERMLRLCETLGATS